VPVARAQAENAAASLALADALEQAEPVSFATESGHFQPPACRPSSAARLESTRRTNRRVHRGFRSSQPASTFIAPWRSNRALRRRWPRAPLSFTRDGRRFNSPAP